MVRLDLSDVCVRYPIYSTSRQRSILGFAANRASFGRLARDAGRIPVVNALNGLTLSLQQGDRLALVGRNGSGKTTFLKLCSGLILPDSGEIDVEGARASIINPGAGLDHEKTGFENVEMMGRMLGISRVGRRLLAEDVAEFTELGDYLNLPVRTYSAGMTIRLLFAVATSVESDILIVDEVIGAGDAHFVEKAAKRIRATFERAKILVLATHSGQIASQLCNRMLWLDGGRKVMLGEPRVVWDAYVNQRPPLEAVA